MNDRVADVLTSLASVRTALFAVDLDRLSAAELLDFIRALETDRRQADSLDQLLIAPACAGYRG